MRYLATAMHYPLHSVTDDAVGEENPCECDTIPDAQDIVAAEAVLEALASAGLVIVPKASSSGEEVVCMGCGREGTHRVCDECFKRDFPNRADNGELGASS